MKIVLFNRSLMSGGIEKCMELLSSELYKENELEIVFSHDDKLDPHIVEILSKYATITFLQDKIIKCDLCIFCNIYFDYEKIMQQIQAKEYFVWIHSKPRELPNCILDEEEFVNKISKFICVSEEVKQEVGFYEKSCVIHNFINDNIEELAKEKNPFSEESKDNLKLTIVSRLSKGKGFERVEKLLKSLEKNNVKYSMKIVGKGRAKEQEIKENLGKYKNVQFVGYQDNPYCYINYADYLILLSDYETWGNVITESKSLHVPCVVTNFPSAKEQITDGKNGIIVNLDNENYDKIVSRMLKEKEILKENLYSFKYHNEIEKWKEII